MLLESRDSRKTLLMLPLSPGARRIGMMEVSTSRPPVRSASDVDFCQALCDASPAVRNAMLYAEMRSSPRGDKLTGLYNRRLFEEQFDAAVARSQSDGEELSLLVVDLDGLKRINDLGGHPSGDEALRALAESLVESSRAGDIACRLGGDEFAVILPGASTEDAIKVAERAQEALNRRGPYKLLRRGRPRRDQPRVVVRPVSLRRHRRLPRQGRGRCATLLGKSSEQLAS